MRFVCYERVSKNEHSYFNLTLGTWLPYTSPGMNMSLEGKFGKTLALRARVCVRGLH